MTVSFHNTIEIEGQELQRAIEKAITQEDKLLTYLRHHRHMGFTAYELYERVLPSAVKTSVGRALNTLMAKGLVNKLSLQVIERHGMPNYLWQARTDEHQLKLL